MKHLFFHILIQYAVIFTFAQTDTLILNNKDLIVGEIKSMNKGVLIMGTSYSDADFRITWDGIKRIKSTSYYLITTSDGRRINGNFHSISDSILKICIKTSKNESKKYLTKDTSQAAHNIYLEVLKSKVVYLNSLQEGFWSRFKFDIDMGFNFTKANRFSQFTLNSKIGYQADRWNLRLYYKDLSTIQNKSNPINRSEFGVNYNYFLPKDNYLLYQLNLLSNTEQLINLRISNMLGFGKYLVHTNRLNLGIIAGGNLNIENFINKDAISKSGEAFLGATYDIFNIGELDLLTSILAFPSLTEKERFRTDFKFDIRYKFGFDLYFKVGTTINFDNKPTDGAQMTDYILQTTIGWSL